MSNSVNEWLKSLKVGDEVAVNQGFERFVLARVEKVTKAHGGTVFVGNRRYDTIGGRERGNDGFYHRNIVEVTPEIREQIERRHYIDTICSAKGDQLAKFTTERLAAICALLQK